jgi:hypothetical protein
MKGWWVAVFLLEGLVGRDNAFVVLAGGRVDVGVVLQRELLEGLPDLLLGCAR